MRPGHFPRRCRLTDSRAFDRVFTGASRVANRYFTVLFRYRDADNGARLGMAVSRRSAPRAVDRNRIKRILREAFREAGHGLPSLDVVVLARGDARYASSYQMRRAVDQLLGRIQRRCVKL